MELCIVNSQYTPVKIVDSFKSLIWTKKYQNYGDFELCVPAESSLVEYIKPDFFFTRDDDESVMIIEKFQIKTDSENGDYFIISGRSLESIFCRRIVKYFYSKRNDFNLVISDLLHESCITRPERFDNIPELELDMSFSLQWNFFIQFSGGRTVLEAMQDICIPHRVGFHTRLENGKIILSFWIGGESSAVFSAEFDNLISSEYTFDYTNYANYMWISGEGEGQNRISTGISLDIGKSGLQQRQAYVDARDLSSNEGAISQSDYISILQERGRQKAQEEHSVIETFEAEIEPRTTYQYKRDYNLGDVITAENGYRISTKARIVEITESWDNTGYKVIPKLEYSEVV